MIRTRGLVQWTLRYFFYFYICIVSFIERGTSCDFSQKIAKLCHHSLAGDKAPCGQNNVGLGNDNNIIVYYDNSKIHYHDSKQNPYKTNLSKTNFYGNSKDAAHPCENNQNAIMYLAGYDDEIFKLKSDIVKHGAGNEILIYFFLYKDRSYYNLGNIYTDLKILEDNVAKYTHYFCLDKISLEKGWYLDKAGHLQRRLTKNHNIQKVVKEIDNDNAFIFPKEKDLTIKDILANIYKFKDSEANESSKATTNKQIKTYCFDKGNAVVRPELHQGNNNPESVYYLGESINSDKNDLLHSNQFYIHKEQSDKLQDRIKIGYSPSNITLKETNSGYSPEAQSCILSNTSAIYAHDTKEMNMGYNKSSNDLQNFNDYNQLFELKNEKTLNKLTLKPSYLSYDNNNKDAYVFSRSELSHIDQKNQNVNKNLIERAKHENYKGYYDNDLPIETRKSTNIQNVNSIDNGLNLKLINKTGYIDESKGNITYFPTTQDLGSKTICDSKNLKNLQFNIKEPYATEHLNAVNGIFNKQKSICYTDCESTDTKKDEEKIAYFPSANALESKEIHESLKNVDEAKYDNQDMQIIDQRPEIISYIEPGLLKDITIKDKLKPNYQEIVNNNQEPLENENIYVTPIPFSGDQITTPVNLNSNAEYTIFDSPTQNQVNQEYEIISSENEPKYFSNFTSSNNNYPSVSYLDTSYTNQNEIFNPNIIQPSNYDCNTNLFTTYTQNLEPINYSTKWSAPDFNYYDHSTKSKSKTPLETYFSQYIAPVNPVNKPMNVKLPPVASSEILYQTNPSYVSIPSYTLNDNAIIPIELKDNTTYGNMSEKGPPIAILKQYHNPHLSFDQQVKGYSTITTPDIVKMTLKRPHDGSFDWKLLSVNANLKEMLPQHTCRGEFSTQIYPSSYYSPNFKLNQEIKSDKLSAYHTYIDDVHQSKQSTVSNKPNVQSIDYRRIPYYINNYDYVSNVGRYYKNGNKLPDENTILIATEDTNLPKFNYSQVVSIIPEKLPESYISPEIEQSVSSVLLNNKKESISQQPDSIDTLSSTESKKSFKLYPETSIPISGVDLILNNKGDSDINKINIIPNLNLYKELKKYIPSKAKYASIKPDMLKDSVPYHLYHFHPSSSNVDSLKLYEPNVPYFSEWFKPRIKNVKQKNMKNIQPFSYYAEPYNLISPEPNILTSETYDSNNATPSVNKYTELDSKVETTHEPSLTSEEFQSIRESYKSLKPNQPGSLYTILPTSNVDFSMQLQPTNLPMSSKTNIPNTFERLKPLVNEATQNIFSQSSVAANCSKFPEINVSSPLKTCQSIFGNNKEPHDSNIINVVPSVNQNLKLDSNLRSYSPVKIKYAPGLPTFSLQKDELMPIRKLNIPLSLEINELKNSNGDLNTNNNVIPTTDKNIQLDLAFAHNAKPVETIYQPCQLAGKYKFMPKLRQENFKYPESPYIASFPSYIDLPTKIELPLSDNKQNNIVTTQYPVADSIPLFAPNLKENIKLFPDTMPTKTPTSFPNDYISTVSAPSNSISLPPPLVSIYTPTSSNFASEAPISQGQSHVIQPSTTDNTTIYLDTLHSTLPKYKVFDTNNLPSDSSNFVSSSPVSQKTKTQIKSLEMTTDTFANPLQNTSLPSKAYTCNEVKDTYDKINKISYLIKQPHVNSQYKNLDNIINVEEELNEIPMLSQKGYTLTSPVSPSTSSSLAPIPSNSMLFTYIPSSLVSPSSISLTRKKPIESFNIQSSDFYVNPTESTLSTFYQSTSPSFEISNEPKDFGENLEIPSINNMAQVNEQQKKYNNLINVPFQKVLVSTTPVSFNTISSTNQQNEVFKIPIANANGEPLQSTPLIHSVYDIFNEPKNAIIKYIKSPYVISGQTNHLQKNNANIINVVESQSDNPIPIKTDLTSSSPALNIAPLTSTPSVSTLAHPNSNLVFQTPTSHKISKPSKFSQLPRTGSYSMGYNKPKDTFTKNNTISYLIWEPQNKPYKEHDYKIDVIERQKEASFKIHKDMSSFPSFSNTVSLAPVLSDSISSTVTSSNAILPTSITDKLKKPITLSKMPITFTYLKDVQSFPTTSNILDTPTHNVVTYKANENVPKFVPYTKIPAITSNLNVLRPTDLAESYIPISYKEIKPQILDMKPGLSIQSPPLSKTFSSSTSEIKSFTPFSPIELKPTKQVYEETQPKYSFISPTKIKEYVGYISEIPKYNFPHLLLESFPNTQFTYYPLKPPTPAVIPQFQKWPQNIIYFPSITKSVQLNNVQAPTYQVPIQIASSSKNSLFYKPIRINFESIPSVQNFNLKPTKSYHSPLRNIIEYINKPQSLSPSTLSLMSERYPQGNIIVPKVQPQFVPLSNYRFYSPVIKFEDSHLKPYMKYTLPCQIPVTKDRSTIISTENPQLMPSSTKLQPKPALEPKPNIKWQPDLIKNKQSVPNQYHRFMYTKAFNSISSVPPRSTLQSTASISPVQPSFNKQNSYTYVQPPLSTVSMDAHPVKEINTYNLPITAKILSSPYQIPYTLSYSKAFSVPQSADIIKDIQLSSLPQIGEIKKKEKVNFIPLQLNFMTPNPKQLPAITSQTTSKPDTSSAIFKPLMGEVVQDNIIREQPSSNTVTKSNKWYLPYTLPKIELMESSPSNPNLPYQVKTQAYQKVKPQIADTSQNYQPPLTIYDWTALDKNSIGTKPLTPIKNSVSYLSYFTPMDSFTSQSPVSPYTSSFATYPLGDQTSKVLNDKLMYLTNKKLPSQVWPPIAFKPIISNTPPPTKSLFYYPKSTVEAPFSIPAISLPCQSVETKDDSYYVPYVDNKIQSDQILKMPTKTKPFYSYLTYSSPTNLRGSKKSYPTSYTFTNAHKAQTENEILKTDKEIKNSTPYVSLDSRPIKAYQLPSNLPISNKLKCFDNKKSRTDISDNVEIGNYCNFTHYLQNKQNVYQETPDLKTQVIQSYAPINSNISPMPYITYTQKQTPANQFITNKSENLGNVVDKHYAQNPFFTEVPCNTYTFPKFGIDITNEKYNYYNSVNYLQNEQPNIHQETPNDKLFYSKLHPKAYPMSDNYAKIQPTTSINPYITYTDPKFVESIRDKTYNIGQIIMRKDGNLERAHAKILASPPEVNYDVYPVNQITSQLPNIGVIKYEPLEINNEKKIHTDNPDIGIRAWKSKLKIVKFKIVADVYETEAYNFEPIIERKYIKKYDLQTVEDTVKRYVQKFYGEPIVLKGVYSFYKPYAIYNINEKYINEGLYFIWPTLCQCGCKKFGCRCQI